MREGLRPDPSHCGVRFPSADFYPKQAMKVNYGSTRNIINAIYEFGQQERTRLVYIGTVAETATECRLYTGAGSAIR